MREVKVIAGEVMRRRGVDARWLAGKANIKVSTAVFFESGDLQRIDLDVLARICQALNVQPGDLLALRSDLKEAA